MSYETRYAARMMMKGREYLESQEAVENRRLDNIALARAEADLDDAFPGGITPNNVAEVLEFQRNRIAARRSELGV